MTYMYNYDSKSFTLSTSAGRLRPQIRTFDVGQPDSVDFIRANRQNGPLRHINLSLLLTD
jgi:ribonucleoside-diphosphate reductase alpha chain